MAARALVLGLDGFDLGLVQQFGPERLPNLHALMARGVFAALESVQPPATLPNWTTFLTGVDPARHGVFDFTTRKGYRVRFTAGTAREVPTVFRQLDRLGLRCACLSFPATWPPEELEHGIFVSGWDAPVAFEADRSFMWPRSLYDETVQRFGAPTFDDVDEFHADAPGWVDRLAPCTRAASRAQDRLGSMVVGATGLGRLCCVFRRKRYGVPLPVGASRPGSPRRPASVSAEQRRGLRRVYEALDQAVGSLLEAAGGDETEVTVLSDHGSGGSSDKVLYLNRLLGAARLASVCKAARPGRRPTEGDRTAALSAAPPRAALSLRQRLAPEPLGVERALRRDRHAKHGRVQRRAELLPRHLSQHRRPRTAGHRSTRAEARNDSTSARGIARHARPMERKAGVSGCGSARRALRRAAFGSRAGSPPRSPPRQRLLLQPDAKLAPAAAKPRSRGAPTPASEPLQKARRHEKLGKKGRSLPGSHRSHGFMTLAGPSVRPAGQLDAHIADLTATLLSRLGLSVPPSFKGRVLWEALRDDRDASAEALPEAGPVTSRATRNEGLIESRLRALGYIE